MPSFNSGGGALITFTQLGSFYFRSFDNLQVNGPQVDGSHLRTGIDADPRVPATPVWGTGRPAGTFAREYIVPDVADLDPVSAILLFDGFVGLPAKFTLDTILITYPPGEDEAAAGTLTGPGWFATGKNPPFELNQELLSPIEWQFQYLPAFTPATEAPA